MKIPVPGGFVLWWSAVQQALEGKEDHNFEFGRISRYGVIVCRCGGLLVNYSSIRSVYQGKPQKTLAGVVGHGTLVNLTLW